MKNIQQCVHRIVEEFLCPERLCSCTSVWHKKVSSCFEWDHIQIIQIFNAVFFARISLLIHSYGTEFCLTVLSTDKFFHVAEPYIFQQGTNTL